MRRVPEPITLCLFFLHGINSKPFFGYNPPAFGGPTYLESADMRYLHAYQYVFVSPKWLANIGLTIVCYLVPLVGPIVAFGYHYEIIEAMLRDGEENYPDFDANRLMPYLTRGAWPFIIQLIAVLPLLLVIFCGYLTFAGMMMTTNGSPEPEFFLVFACLFLVVVLFAGVVLPLVVLPLEVRAGLTKSFRGAFSREFYFDFVKRCWKELICAQLFIFASGLFLTLLGTLLCLVGRYPAEALVLFARTHLLFQVYKRYLEKGGIPPVVKEEGLMLGS
jgi:hypothetical protein